MFLFVESSKIFLNLEFLFKILKTNLQKIFKLYLFLSYKNFNLQVENNNQNIKLAKPELIIGNSEDLYKNSNIFNCPPSNTSIIAYS